MHLGSTFGRKRQTFITEKREKKRTNQKKKKRINSDQKNIRLEVEKKIKPQETTATRPIDGALRVKRMKLNKQAKSAHI